MPKLVLATTLALKASKASSSSRLRMQVPQRLKNQLSRLTGELNYQILKKSHRCQTLPLNWKVRSVLELLEAFRLPWTRWWAIHLIKSHKSSQSPCQTVLVIWIKQSTLTFKDNWSLINLSIKCRATLSNQLYSIRSHRATTPMDLPLSLLCTSRMCSSLLSSLDAMNPCIRNENASLMKLNLFF